MSKAAVTRVFVGSLIAIVAGCVLLFVAVILAAANSAFIMNGPDVVGFHSSGLGVGLVALFAIALLAVLGGGIGQFVAWIGAVLNTVQLEDKTWFLVVLLLGLLSFGFIAMLAYVLAGPDGTARTEERRAIAEAPTLAPGKA